MTTPTKRSFFANEPQLVQGFVLWVLTQAGALLIGHTDWITTQQWSGLASALVPIISAVVIGLITVVWRNWLSPAWKAVQGEIDKTGSIGVYIEDAVKKAVEQAITDLEHRLPFPVADANAVAPVAAPGSVSDEDLRNSTA